FETFADLAVQGLLSESRRLEMKRTAQILAAFGLALGMGIATGGCLVTARGHIDGGAIVTYQEPPPPQVEVVQYRTGYVWMKGHYYWSNGQWTWMPGRLAAAQPGYNWQDGRWDRRDGGWQWIEGQWIVGGNATVSAGGYQRPTGYQGGGYQG